MPKVGKKDFSYDAKGMKEAREEAKKTGKDMVINYDEGGIVGDYQDTVKKKYGGMVE
jgi:hypothetical protein|tara:strand:+ start:333 stop:503 length:171 start_codon:yes stop_codon:yes gene_type:complete